MHAKEEDVPSQPAGCRINDSGNRSAAIGDFHLLVQDQNG